KKKKPPPRPPPRQPPQSAKPDAKPARTRMQKIAGFFGMPKEDLAAVDATEKSWAQRTDPGGYSFYQLSSG
ncbi:hypothetical protein CSUI_003454, partial [Cystoisospora suis]